MSNRGKLPKVVWNGKTLLFDYPLDSAIAYSQSAEGSELYRNSALVVDAWDYGEDYVLEGDARWIPLTAWEGANGWRAFLAWCRGGNTFIFYPDKTLGTSYLATLLDPMAIRPELESDGTRRVHLKIAASTEILGY